MILGALTQIAATLSGEDREQALTLWRRRGQRVFGTAAAERNSG